GRAQARGMPLRDQGQKREVRDQPLLLDWPRRLSGVKRYVRQYVKTESMRCGGSEIDRAATHKRAAVIDSHNTGSPVGFIGDAHTRAEGQGAMRGCETSRLGALAVCCTLARIGIDRRNSGLGHGCR